MKSPLSHQLLRILLLRLHVTGMARSILPACSGGRWLRSSRHLVTERSSTAPPTMAKCNAQPNRTRSLILVRCSLLVVGCRFAPLKNVIRFHGCWPSVHSAACVRVQGADIRFHDCWLEASIRVSNIIRLSSIPCGRLLFLPLPL